MNKPVYYLAHPVTGAPAANAYSAIEWIRWLTLQHPEKVFAAPWVAEVLAFAGDTMTPEFYDRVLSDDEEIVRHMDGILLVGGRISTGMQRELDAALAAGKAVVDWSQYASPSDVPVEFKP